MHPVDVGRLWPMSVSVAACSGVSAADRSDSELKTIVPITAWFSDMVINSVKYFDNMNSCTQLVKISLSKKEFDKM